VVCDMGAEADFEAHIRILKDKRRHYSERQVAAKVLGETRDERAIQPLIDARAS